MKTIKKILKGVLLWVTALTVMLFISGVDSITDQGYLVPWMIVCAVLYYLCYKHISEEELNTLSGAKWLDKKLGSSDDEF